MATLKVEIVTPEAPLWVGQATELVARSSEGWFTVLPEHMDMVGDVVSSVVRVGTAEGEIAIAVHGGFFQVGPGEVDDETLATVLAGIESMISTSHALKLRRRPPKRRSQLTCATTKSPPKARSRGRRLNGPNFD